MWEAKSAAAGGGGRARSCQPSVRWTGVGWGGGCRAQRVSGVLGGREGGRESARRGGRSKFHKKVLLAKKGQWACASGRIQTQPLPGLAALASTRRGGGSGARGRRVLVALVARWSGCKGYARAHLGGVDHTRRLSAGPGGAGGTSAGTSAAMGSVASASSEVTERSSQSSPRAAAREEPPSSPPPSSVPAAAEAAAAAAAARDDDDEEEELLAFSLIAARDSSERPLMRAGSRALALDAAEELPPPPAP